MKTFAAFLCAAPLLLLSVQAATSTEECDMKTVIKAYFCAECDEVYEKKDLISDKEYYFCKDCEIAADKAGDCEWCNAPLEKKVSGKDVCPACYAPPAECEACVKVYYECPDCGETALEPGACPVCDDEKSPQLEKITSLAVIQYVCEGCYSPSLLPGRCVSDECDHEGQERVKTCSESGTFPHVKSK
ncbi:MAG: hypothetical protein HY812_04090 [Planctomycetes bacterium]|nr:hypothetical protein [Planctomycetota bacterium]